MATKILAPSGEEVTRTDLYALNPYDIEMREDLRGRRWAPDEVAIISLARSLAINGQEQPCKARRNPDKSLLLVSGFTRCAAARLVRDGFTDQFGVKHHNPDFKLQVRVVVCNDEHAIVSNIVENNDRNDVSPIDHAFNQNRLREQYLWTDIRIAEKWGWTAVQVGQYKRLLEHDEEVQRLIHQGLLGVKPAVDLLSITDLDDRRQAIMAATKESGKVNGEAIREQIRAHHINDDDTQGETDDSGDSEEQKPKKPSVTVTRRPLSKVVKALQVIKENDEYHQAIRRMAGDFIRFIDGRASETSLVNSFERLLDAKRGR